MKAVKVLILVNFAFMTYLIRVESYVNSKCTHKTWKLLSNGQRIQVLIDDTPECAKVIERACEPISNVPLRKLWRPKSYEALIEAMEHIQSLGLNTAIDVQRTFMLDLRFSK